VNRLLNPLLSWDRPQGSVHILEIRKLYESGLFLLQESIHRVHHCTTHFILNHDCVKANAWGPHTWNRDKMLEVGKQRWPDKVFIQDSRTLRGTGEEMNWRRFRLTFAEIYMCTIEFNIFLHIMCYKNQIIGWTSVNANSFIEQTLITCLPWQE
jgi:hypothetical protein